MTPLSSGSSVTSPGVSEALTEAHSFLDNTLSNLFLSWKSLLKTDLKTSGLVEQEQAAYIRELLEKAGPSLDPLIVTEITVYVGTTLQSLEHVNIACNLLIDAVDSKVNWHSVFLHLPQTDKTLKIRSIACFAFLMELYRRLFPKSWFPTEILLNRRWTNVYNQVLLIRWIVLKPTSGNGTTQATTGSVNSNDFLQAYLRDIEIAADEQLLCQLPLELLGSVSSRIWSNSQLTSILLNIASDRPSHEVGALRDPEDIEASKIAYELLRKPIASCPALLLTAIINSASIAPARGRLFAIEVLESFWNNVQQNQQPADPVNFLRWLASLNPSRFVSSILGATYSRLPTRLPEVILALKSDKQLLLNALDGPPAPFRFHLLHEAWSSDFNSGLWLKNRLKLDTTGELAKEFLLFLILTLCPPEILQQRLPPHGKHPMSRLNISRQELTFYLLIILGAFKDSAVLSSFNIPLDTSWEIICKKSPDVLDAELFQLKQACSILLPQLASFIQLLRPTAPYSSVQTNALEVSDHVLFLNKSPLASKNFFDEQQHRLILQLQQSQLQPNSGSEANVDTSSPDNALVQEVHRYFALLYTGSMNCNTLIELMKQLASFPIKSHEYQVFNHMVKLLFHECRFFPKYPLTELALTAQLMGKMIFYELLVGHGPHGTAHLLAIRCVLEALRKGKTTKMFRFAVTALEQFVGPRMVSCPDFLSAFVVLPDVRKHFPTYVAYAENCLAVLPPKFVSMRYIKASTVATLPLPSPPAIVSNSFSLSSYFFSAETLAMEPVASTANNNKPVTKEQTHPFSLWDGLSCQRRMSVNGQHVLIQRFGLGTIEQLITAELSHRVATPPAWFTEQLTQTFNTLAVSNVNLKAEDFRQSIQPEWQAYVALYIVKSRVSKEANLHQLYLTFIERLAIPKLLDIVTSTTYDCINILLSYCDDAKESSPYRTVLKNLGLWLGIITLARNCPLRGKFMDIKNMLFNGYEYGRLRVLLPLCCKVLEGIGKSRSFRPPNPWTVGIFSLLAEIRHLPGLVTPLVFEIDLLFKSLGVNVNDYVGRTNHLARKGPPPIDSLDFNIQTMDLKPELPVAAGSSGIGQSGSDSVVSSTANAPTQLQSQLQLAAFSPHHQQENPPPLTNQVTASTSAQHPLGTESVPPDFQALAKAALSTDSSLVRTFGPPNLGVTPMKQHIGGAGNISIPPSVPSVGTNGSSLQRVPENSTLLAGLMKSTVISPSLALFQLKPALKVVVSHAMERAIKEIVQVVSERSVSISCVTTLEIVLKDFATEINDSLVRRAAHLMAAGLAGSLALVTCREPLRAALCQHLRSLLLSASDKLGDDQRLVDQVVIVATADNIELGCVLVEEAVIQKALQDVEEGIAPALAARRQAKLMGNQRYQDPAYFQSGSRWPANLPPLLQPSSVLTGVHLQVYKDFLSFGLLKRMQNSRTTSSTVPSSVPQRSVEKPLPISTTFTPQGLSSKLDNDVGFINNETRESQPSSSGHILELQAISTKAEEHLTRLRELVQEVAFCSPYLPYKITPQTKYATPLGATIKFAPNLPAVTSSLLMLSRLPSDHEFFSSIVTLPALCNFSKDQDAAYISVTRRVLKMITDATALYQEPLAVLKGSDVAGLYIESCLGALACLYHSPQFPKSQFHNALMSWVTNFFDDRCLGADIVVSLVRYDLLNFSQLDQILVEHIIASVEKKNIVPFENLARILYKVATASMIYLPNIAEALNALKGSYGLLLRLPLPTIGSSSEQEDSSIQSSFRSLFVNSTLSLQDLPPSLFSNARAIVMERVNEVFRKAALESSLMTQQEETQRQGQSKSSPLSSTVISSVTQLIDNYATFGGPICYTRRFPLPPELTPAKKELITSLFDQWMLCSVVVGSEKRSKVWAEYFQSMSKQQLLQMDQETDAFFTGCIDHAIEISMAASNEVSCNNQSNSQDVSENDSFETSLPPVEVEIPNLKPLDAFAKMIVAMMRLIDSAQISPVLILQRALSVIVRCIHRDSEVAGKLNQIAYYRILQSLIWGVIQPNRGLDQHLMSSLLSFSNAYQALNPCVCPAFAFCWIDFISYRYFLPKVLKHYKDWPHYQRLLSSLFRFLYPLIRHGKFTPGVQLLYKGTLRLLLVLLHDFSEFLCDYGVVFCDDLPLNAIQLRNLILSAIPRDMKLPDPFAANLKIDMLPESRRIPRLAGRLPVLLIKHDIKGHLKNYWKTKDIEHLDNVLQKLTIADKKTAVTYGIRYDVSIINAILLQIVAQLTTERAAFSVLNQSNFTSASLAEDVAFYLVTKLDAEGRYVVLCCISNHLRYPNMHTNYFSALLLWLFGVSAKNEIIQEQITRVMLERLVAHRPHPWGLLVTFIELIKNPKYNFWNCSFVYSVPEAQRLFLSVAQMCLVQRNASQPHKEQALTSMQQQPDQEQEQYTAATRPS